MRKPIQSFRDLDVWQRAIDLAVLIYQVTDDMPKRETYALTDQIRRSASSVPANIAEGSARRTTRDLVRFLEISRSSLAELESHLELAIRLKMLNELTYVFEEADHVGRMLTKLRLALEASPRQRVAGSTTHSPRPTTHE